MDNKEANKNAQVQVQPVVKAVGFTSTEAKGIKKIAKNIVNNLATSNAKNIIINEIILPNVLDIVNTWLAGAMGIEPNKSRKLLNDTVTTVRASAYHSASNSNGYSVISTPTTTVRTVYDYGLPILETEAEVDELYFNCESHMARYPNLSVANYIQYASGVPNSADWNYGWLTLEALKNAKKCHIRRADGSTGWVLKMPRPEPLPD